MKRNAKNFTSAALALLIPIQAALAQDQTKSIKELNAMVRSAEKRVAEQNKKVSKSKHTVAKILTRMIHSEEEIIKLKEQQIQNDSGQTQKIEDRMNEIERRPIPTKKLYNVPAGPPVNAKFTARFPTGLIV